MFSRKTIKCAVPPGPGKSGFRSGEPLPWQKSKCKNNRKSRIPGSFEKSPFWGRFGILGPRRPQRVDVRNGAVSSWPGFTSRQDRLRRSPTLSNAPGFEWARMCGSASSPFYEARTCRTQAGQKNWKLRFFSRSQRTPERSLHGPGDVKCSNPDRRCKMIRERHIDISQQTKPGFRCEVVNLEDEARFTSSKSEHCSVRMGEEPHLPHGRILPVHGQFIFGNTKHFTK